MRLNVYGEELTDRIELITKEVDGITFVGVRFWMKFPNSDWWIHRKVDGELDDDSSAVTFWSNKCHDLAERLNDAVRKLRVYEIESLRAESIGEPQPDPADVMKKYNS